MALKILVTGSSGFIGSNLCKLLRSRGHQVLGVDLADGADFVADINDFDWSLIEFEELDGVVHLAAKTSVPESVLMPDIYHRTNVEATRRLFNWCSKKGVVKIIFASSAAVYGDTDVNVKRVGQEGELGSPYAVTKLTGEEICKKLTSNLSNFIPLRFFNVYGEGQNVDSGYSAVIPAFIDRAINGENLIIYGDGNQTRDFVHVIDVVKSILGALENDIGKNTVLNIGTGRGTSVIDLAKTILEVLENNGLSKPEIEFLPVRDGDLDHSIADTQGLSQILNTEEMILLTDGINELVGQKISSI